MQAQLLILLGMLESRAEKAAITDIVTELTSLSVSIQMASMSVEDAIISFESKTSAPASKEVREAIEFGYLSGLECE